MDDTGASELQRVTGGTCGSTRGRPPSPFVLEQLVRVPEASVRDFSRPIYSLELLFYDTRSVFFAALMALLHYRPLGALNGLSHTSGQWENRFFLSFLVFFFWRKYKKDFSLFILFFFWRKCTKRT